MAGPGPLLDASTPAFTTITKAVTLMTTAAFSPAAESLIVVFYGLQAVDSVSLQSVTSMSNTGTALVWANKVRSNHSGSAPGGSAEIWWAYNYTAQAGITVTGNFARTTGASTDLNGGLMAVKVFTAAGSTLAPFASTAAVGTATSAPTASLTPIGLNSWVWGVLLNWSSTVVGVAVSGQTVVESLTDANGGDAEWTQRQNAVTPTRTATAINDTNTIPTWLEAIVEIPQAPFPAGPPIYSGYAAVQRAAVR